jgi:hypothetical protein
VIPDAAAAAFAEAAATVEPVLYGVLKSLERRRLEEQDRGVIRDLRRAFRDFYRRRPNYAMLPVQKPTSSLDGPENGNAGVAEAGDGREGTEAGSRPGDTLELLPPGPLAAVRIVPAAIRMEPNERRTLRAEPLDASGRRVEEPVHYAWELEGLPGEIVPADILRAVPDRLGPKVALAIGETTGEGILRVRARSAGAAVEAEAPVTVDEQAGGAGGEGIPEPEFVEEPAARWRSRMREERWQVNSAHPDYRAIAPSPTLKLRYLTMLFGKEVVERSHQDPRLAPPLEQMIEVVAYADRSLSARRNRNRRKP